MKPRRRAEPDELGAAALRVRARNYLESHAWCRRLRRLKTGRVWPGILGVFDAEIEPARRGVDDRLWIVVGDVPPAYLVRDNAPDIAGALKGYAREMARWVRAVRGGRSVEKLIPVRAQDGPSLVRPSKRSARLLAARIDFIESELIPLCDRARQP